MIVFVVKLQPGTSHEGLLSPEIERETLAQVMRAEEAAQLGFSGFTTDDPNLRLIVVRESDAGWIEKALERAPQVVGFQAQRVDL